MVTDWWWWSDPLQLSESHWNHYIWEVNQWDAPKTATPAASTGQQKGPNSSPQQCPTISHTTNTSKVEQIGLQSFVSSTISPDLWPVNYHFFKHLNNFLQGKCSHNQQDAENAFQEFVESQSIDFYATGINKLISHWQKCVDCNGFYKDVFEPSYNDLKFMVKNHNYICTNLIYELNCKNLVF